MSVNWSEFEPVAPKAQGVNWSDFEPVGSQSIPTTVPKSAIPEKSPGLSDLYGSDSGAPPGMDVVMQGISPGLTATAKALDPRGGPTLADVGNAIMSGAANVTTTFGQYVKTLGELMQPGPEGTGINGDEGIGAPPGMDVLLQNAASSGERLRGIGQEAEKSWMEGTTRAGQEAAGGDLRNRPVGSFVMAAAQSAPGMATMVIPAAGVAKWLEGAGFIGKAFTYLTNIGISPQRAEIIAKTLPGAIGGGVSEGAISGAQNAAETGQEINKMDILLLEKHPYFQRALAFTDSSLPIAERQQQARAAVARAAEQDVFIKTGFWDMLTGILSGGGVIGQMTRPSKGIVKGVVAGVKSEVPQEFVQSGGEQYLQNIAAKNYYEATRKPLDNVLKQAVIGGGAAFILGGTGGGIHGLLSEKESRTFPATASGIPSSISETLQRAPLNAEDILGRVEPVAPPPDIMAATTVDEAITAAQLYVTGSPKVTAEATPATPAAALEPIALMATPSLPSPQEAAQGLAAATGMQFPDVSSTGAPIRPELVPVSSRAQSITAPAQAEVSAEPGIQNRDRGRAASIAQMSDIAARPDYLRLGPSRAPETGAPLVFSNEDAASIPPEAMGNKDVAVLSDGRRVPFQYAVVDAFHVEPSHWASGAVNPSYGDTSPGVIRALNNGRIAGLRAAFDRGTSTPYVQALTADSSAIGIDPATIHGINNPILVRLYSQKENTPDIAAKSQGTALGMSATEQAVTDAKHLTSDVLGAYQGGDIVSPANRDFVRAFVGKAGDMASMMDAGGNLSQDGRRRIEAGLMTAAYGDTDMVSALFESTDTNIKAIGDALREVAGEWADMRDRARSGQIDPQMDITGNLMQAVEIVKRSRIEGKSIYDLVHQADMLTGAVDLLTEGWIRVFYRGDKFGQARSKQTVAFGLLDYIQGALQTSRGTDLLGEAKRVQSADILKSTTEKLNAKETTPAQSSLLPPSGQPSGQDLGVNSAEGKRPVGKTGGGKATGKATLEQQAIIREKDHTDQAEIEDINRKMNVLSSRRTDTQGFEPISDRSITDAKLFGNSNTRQAIQEQGFDALSIERQKMVLANVRRSVYDKQVLRSIIESIPVDVMNVLLGQKISPKELLHDPSMFADALTIPNNGPIPRLVISIINSLATQTSATKNPSTLVATEKSASLGDLRRLPINTSAAYSAADRNLPIPDGGREFSRTSAATEGTSARMDRGRPPIEGAPTEEALIDRHRVENILQNRRKDIALRRKVSEMSLDEMRTALLIDAKTGLFNDRAYAEHDKQPVQVVIDLDSLKWINDVMGHDSGDTAIIAMGKALARHSDQAYRLSSGGDEFAVQANSNDEADRIMRRVTKTLSTAEVTAVMPDGTTIKKTGVNFSYGYGPTLKQADTALAASKSQREAAGQRARRGEEPPGVVKIPADRQQDQGNQATERVTETPPKGGVSAFASIQESTVDSEKYASARGSMVNVKAVSLKGKTVTVKEDAAEALARIDEQESLAQRLLECLST